MIFQGGVSGTVIAYNYFTAGYQNDNSFVHEDIGTHSAFPFFNLFEGNYSANVHHDTIFLDQLGGSHLSSTS